MKTTVIAAALSLLAVTNSHASIVTSPTSLNPGDQYRLVFVTSTKRNAYSNEPADYNSFVSTAANAVPELLSLGIDWFAMASTLHVSARANTGTDPSPPGDTGVPIYQLNDTKIADHYDDLWDASIDAPISVYETGLEILNTTDAWTGSDAFGQIFSARWLGTNNGTFDSMYGLAGNGINTNGWFSVTSNPQEYEKSLFGLSGVLTVPNSADFNGDNLVNGIDFLTWQENLGTVGPLATHANGDANGDDLVDAADLAVWELQYGSAPPLATIGAVPEPSTLALGMLALSIFRRREVRSRVAPYAVNLILALKKRSRCDGVFRSS